MNPIPEAATLQLLLAEKSKIITRQAADLRLANATIDMLKAKIDAMEVRAVNETKETRNERA